MQKMYHHSQETLSQLRQTLHSLNMQEINESASTIKTNAEIVQETYNMITALGRAKGYQSRIGIASVGFLLSLAGLPLAYRRL